MDSSFRLLRTTSLFDLPEAFFRDSSKEVVKIHFGKEQATLPSSSKQQESTPTGSNEDQELLKRRNPEEPNLTCRTCKVSLSSQETYRQHFQTEWHNYNLKLKLQSLVPVNEKEFLDLKESGELDESDPSDESDKDEVEEPIRIPKTPKITLFCVDSTIISLWRHTLFDFIPQTTEEVSKALTDLPSRTKWTILLCSGGRFAGAIFDKKVCLQHKTFHRYTVRKKQGGAQSSKDSQSSSSRPKSAGASLRRYNEVRLREEIQELLQEWKPLIDECQIVFLFAPGANKAIFFDKDVFSKDDIRVRSIPTTPRKPTFLEVKRMHQILSTVEFYEQPQTDKEETEQAADINESEGDETSENNDEPNHESEQELQESTESETDQLLVAIQEKNFNQVKTLLQSNYKPQTQSNAYDFVTPLFAACEINSPEMVDLILKSDLMNKEQLNAQIPRWVFRTALHRVSVNGNVLILEKLLEHGADPTIQGLDSKTAYDVAKNPKVRTAFRLFAGKNLNLWNWQGVGIVPLTESMLVAKEKSKTEKKKKKRKAKQQRKQELREIDEKEKKMQLEKEEKEKKMQLEREEKQRKIQLERQEKEAKAKREQEKETALRQQVRAIEQTRDAILSSMTERDKRALAAENRLKKSSEVTCALCGADIMLVPYEWTTEKFCSSDCLTAFLISISE